MTAENTLSRVAVVTGALGGLGVAMCARLAAAGRTVVAVDLASGDAHEKPLRDATRAWAERVHVRTADVSDYDACCRLVEQVQHEIGPIDILVNAAGITRDTSLRKMDPEQWHALMRVNLDGLFNMSRPVVEGMCQRGFGRIVNISSVNGQTGQFGQTNYSAAKAGVHGFTMALARETARKGVTVNTISPGYCNTAMVQKVPEAVRDDIVARIPVGRLGEPDDVARAVGFLSGDDNGYITGINLPVNGGYFMSF